MTEIGTFEAKNKFSELLDKVENGEEIVITRRGRPVAKLVAFHGTADRENAMRRIRERARALKLNSDEADEMIGWRRDGLK